MWKRPCRRRKIFVIKEIAKVKTNDTDGLTKGWVFNDENYAMGKWRQQSGSVVMIWGGMIGNEHTSLFRVPKELNCPLACIARS